VTLNFKQQKKYKISILPAYMGETFLARGQVQHAGKHIPRLFSECGGQSSTTLRFALLTS
jgi:hypothetical protein